jgi:hypothetical protein
MEYNGEHYTCGDLLVITYIKIAIKVKVPLTDPKAERGVEV